MRLPISRVAALLLLLAAAGCGQKGPLYLPDRNRASVPAQPAAPPPSPAPSAAPPAASPPATRDAAPDRSR
jgi:predicted small lipoprotein YifL